MGGDVTQRYAGFIIDLDGVMYLLHQPITGSALAIGRLQEQGLPFVFLTNNASATPHEYVERLRAMEVDVSEEAFVTSAQAVGALLDREGVGPGHGALLMGGAGLALELERRGFVLLEGEERAEAEWVFVAWDRTFDYDKLKAAVIAIRRGARFIATNTDATYPTPEGLWPGAGSIVAAVSTGCGRQPEVCGKPNPLIVELALERLGVGAREALLVGDRLDSDIEAGLAAGVDTAMVLTGISTEAEVESTGIRPTIISRSLAALLAS